MIRTFHGENFDTLFSEVVSEIIEHPDYVCSPRGSMVKEILCPTIVLTNPRARVLSSPARAADYGFASGEFLWYWSGRNDLDSLSYYNKRAKGFSDDGVTVNSAYGYRTKTVTYYGSKESGMLSQWDACKKTLLDDNDSRRALLIINRAADNVLAATEGSKDVPCTLSLQFFIRNNKLILHANMRSNDSIWGLSYDLFSFTLLQEMMLLELKASGLKDLELGEYIHTAGSLHIYDRHFEMCAKIIEEDFVAAKAMEPLNIGEFSSLLTLEEELRIGKKANNVNDRFTGGVRFIAEQLVKHRNKRDAERRRALGSGDSDRPAVV